MTSVKSTLDNLSALLASQQAASVSLQSGLGDIRREIKRCRDALSEIESASPDLAEIKVRLHAVVEKLARQAASRLDIERLTVPPADFDGDAYLTRVTEFAAQTTGIPIAPTAPGDDHDEIDQPLIPQSVRIRSGLSALHMAAFMDPAALEKRLLAEAKAELATAGVEPISSENRVAETERLQREIVDLERAEERLCRMAEASGLSVPRRANANPRWLLAHDADLVEAAA